MPDVPLDEACALRALSIGLADRAGRLPRLGERGARGGSEGDGTRGPQSAGALAGAWFGFNATAEDLVAVLTTIVGATAGANLALLTLDIAWDRRAHDRFAARLGALAGAERAVLLHARDERGARPGGRALAVGGAP